MICKQDIMYYGKEYSMLIGKNVKFNCQISNRKSGNIISNLRVKFKYFQTEYELLQSN